MLRFLSERLRRGGAVAEATTGVASAACVPDGSLVVAIGDIHGRIDLLTTLEAEIARFAAGRPETRRVIVCLGDYIDRGYHSKNVIEHLRGPAPDGFERVCLLGNHEDYLLRFFGAPDDAPAWLANGGRETLMSYGVALPPGIVMPEDIARAREELLAHLPDGHVAFLRGLKTWHVEGDYLFVHAGIRPGVALDLQTPDDLLWIREPFLGSTADHGHIVVHGHTVREEPELRANRIGIDTGAYATGRLTALALVGATQTFLHS